MRGETVEDDRLRSGAGVCAFLFPSLFYLVVMNRRLAEQWAEWIRRERCEGTESDKKERQKREYSSACPTMVKIWQRSHRDNFKHSDELHSLSATQGRGHWCYEVCVGEGLNRAANVCVCLCVRFPCGQAGMTQTNRCTRTTVPLPSDVSDQSIIANSWEEGEFAAVCGEIKTLDNGPPALRPCCPLQSQSNSNIHTNIL